MMKGQPIKTLGAEKDEFTVSLIFPEVDGAIGYKVYRTDRVWFPPKWNRPIRWVRRFWGLHVLRKAIIEVLDIEGHWIDITEFVGDFSIEPKERML